MVMMVMTPLAVAKNWATREWYVFCSSRDVIDSWSVSGLVKCGGCGREKVLVASKCGGGIVGWQKNMKKDCCYGVVVAMLVAAG